MVDKMQAITFSDTQNGQSKTYKMAVGTKITITDSVYELKKDGLYKDGNKLKDNVVNVILPQLSAVSLFDADKDGDIDLEDSKFIEEKSKAYDVSDDGCNLKEWFADKLDNALRASKSEYSVERQGFGAVSTCVCGNIFSATFENQTYHLPEGREVKSIFIELPQ